MFDSIGPPRLDVDRHRQERIDQRDGVGARLFRRAGERRHIGHVGRELRDHRQARHLPDRADDVEGAVQAAPERDAAFLDVRARDVQLERGHAFRVRQDARELDILVERAAADVDDHRRAAVAQLRQLFLDEPVDADPLQADRIEHAGGRLDDSFRRMALAFGEEQSLDRDAAEQREVDDVRVFDAVAEAAAGGDDRIA